MVYVDEVMTTVSTIPRKEWSRKNDYFIIDRKLYHKETLATIAGISANKGMELISTHDKSINVDKFK